MGSEGPQWWTKYEDKVRDLPKRGILDRCKRTGTCPKIVETFGGAEVFALKMTTSWVGTDAKKDIRSEEHTSELQSRLHLVCRLLLEKKKYTRTLASTWVRCCSVKMHLANVGQLVQ